jgi:molybdopterin synthase catalytic subunit
MASCRRRGYLPPVVRVLYFAACRERASTDSEDLDLGGRTVAAAVSALVERHPKLKDIVPHCRVAVNATFARPGDAVPDGAEIALIPPVAGG